MYPVPSMGKKYRIVTVVQYPSIDPVALSLGPFQVRWYGLMYLVGFVAAWWLARGRLARLGDGADERWFDDLLFYCVLGVILGGRLGYMLFYQGGEWLSDPLSALRIWEGGMSFHGGLLGVLSAVWLFARRRGWAFFRITDFIAPLVPIGLGAVRIGNFINGELWGRVTRVPWGMQLSCARFPEHCAGLAPGAPLSPPLHPSQLYEAALEGLVLFVILWLYSRRPRPTMAVSGLFLACYGAFRILVEFVRQPDAQLGFLAFDWLTMGQLLSLPMLAGGLLLLALAYRRS
jgi:phosphatidylglycerol:prolipoprotein diacylglycerol transferase